MRMHGLEYFKVSNVVQDRTVYNLHTEYWTSNCLCLFKNAVECKNSAG